MLELKKEAGDQNVQDLNPMQMYRQRQTSKSKPIDRPPFSKMPHPKVIPFLIGSALFLLGGYTLYFYLPEIVVKQIQKRVNISPGSPIYELWRDTPIPIYQRFYMFNVTNAGDVERSGAKPIVQEIGPFTYRMKFQKNQIYFHENQTVSYKESKTWLFVRSLSIMDENTVITTVNTPLVSTLTVLQRVPPAVRMLITLALDTITEGLFIRRSVKQLTFAGYPDLLVTFGPMIDPRVPNNHGRFGYLYPKNNTADGLYTVFTGVDDSTKLNLIDRLNGKEKLSLWDSDECNSLNNTFNGQLHPSLIDNFTPSYQFFNELFGRKFNLNFESIHEPYEGVKAYKYVFDENNFKNSLDYPPNACYTSKLHADQPISSNRRAPLTDQTLPPQSALLNLARRRLAGESLLSRPSVDRAESADAQTGREESPDGRSSRRTTAGPTMARQAMRMIANSLASRTLEQLGRLGERISLQAPARNTNPPSPIESIPSQTLSPRRTPMTGSSLPLLERTPVSAALTRNDHSEHGNQHSMEPSTIRANVAREEAATTQPEVITTINSPTVGPTLLTGRPLPPLFNSPVAVQPPVSPISGIFPSLISGRPREVPLLSGLFRSGEPGPLDNAREFARNLSRSAPLNSMISNVLNSSLVSRLLSIRNRPEVLSRRSRQVEARRERRNRHRRRQTRENTSFARLREMNKFPSGAFDFSKIAFGAPILLSLPHFLKADPFYLEQVIGLRPNASRHEFFLDVEPITGASVNTAMRFQLNLALTRNPGLFRFRNIRETVLPILWQEVTLEMPASHQRKLRLLNAAPQWSAYIVLGLFSLASIVLLGFAIRAYRSKNVKNDPSMNGHFNSSSISDTAMDTAMANKLARLEQQRVYRPGDNIPTAQQEYNEDNDLRSLHQSRPERKHGIDNPIPVET